MPERGRNTLKTKSAWQLFPNTLHNGESVYFWQKKSTQYFNPCSGLIVVSHKLHAGRDFLSFAGRTYDKSETYANLSASFRQLLKLSYNSISYWMEATRMCTERMRSVPTEQHSSNRASKFVDRRFWST